MKSSDHHNVVSAVSVNRVCVVGACRHSPASRARSLLRARAGHCADPDAKLLRGAERSRRSGMRGMTVLGSAAHQLVSHQRVLLRNSAQSVQLGAQVLRGAERSRRSGMRGTTVLGSAAHQLVSHQRVLLRNSAQSVQLGAQAGPHTSRCSRVIDLLILVSSF